ncbi:MAG: tetratricopeptide repeat protein [Gammaproteobacteria bacterium]|nr:tetratricopeptide repeat protein [Gammaproteobacteria bacterium]
MDKQKKTDNGEKPSPYSNSAPWQHLLEVNTGTIPDGATPNLLLSPQLALLDYQTRDEDPSFEAWLEEEHTDPVRISVITAPEGSGKTRWLLAQCERRNNQWCAGFLRNETGLSPLTVYQSLLSYAPRVLLVMDSAEDRTEQLVHLLEAAEQTVQQGARHLRFVLLTQNLTELWWKRLRPQLSDYAGTWTDNEARKINYISLAPLPRDISKRGEIFHQAVAAFRPYIETPATEFDTPNLSHTDYDRPLYIQLAALNLLRGGKRSLDESGLLHDALTFEVENWQQAGFTQAAIMPVLAVITLWGGLAGDKLHSLIAQWPKDDVISLLDTDQLTTYLQRRYPTDDESGSTNTGIISDLKPNCLGEALVLQTLKHYDANAVIRIAFGPGANDVQRKQALNVLARTPCQELEHLNVLKATLIDQLYQLDNLEFAIKLMTLHPIQSDSMTELNEAATRMVLINLEQNKQDSQDFLSHLVDVYIHHGVTLNHIGQTEAAIEKLYQADILLRSLSAQQPDVFIRHLAHNLNNLATMLYVHGQSEAALEPAGESLELYRQLAEQRPAEFIPTLANSLSNLSYRLYLLNRNEAAIEPSLEAVTLYRQLIEEQPDAYRHDLGMSLDLLSKCQTSLGQHESALETAFEVVTLYRQLAAEQPDTFMPSLSSHLSNLSVLLSDLGLHEAALAPANEAVEIAKQAVMQGIDCSSHLSRNLNILSNLLLTLGHDETAVDISLEAVSLHQQLAEEEPDIYLPGLSYSLERLGSSLANTDQLEPAVMFYRKMVDIRRDLAAERPVEFTPDLASGLAYLGLGLSEIGQDEDALEAFNEAGVLFLRLATQSPETYTSDLAGNNINLANNLAKLGQHEAALNAAREAVSLFRHLAEKQPDIYLARLALSLGALGDTYRQQSNTIEANTSIAEGLSILTPLFLRFPQKYAQLIEQLYTEYMETCELTGRTPDTALLTPVVEVFGQLNAEAILDWDDQNS